MLKTDFAGVHGQHAAAWSSFNTTLQIVFVIEAVPWIAAGTLARATPFTFETLFQSPLFLIALAFSGSLGMIGY